MNIEIFPGIRLGTTDTPIEFTSYAEELKPGKYQIWSYRFTEPRPYHLPYLPESTGCFFILPPWTHTNVGLITDPKTIVSLEATYGNGEYISTRDVSNLVDAQRVVTHEAPLVKGKRLFVRFGTIYSLKSGKHGLIVQSLTTPPFRPGVTEETIPINDPRAPLSFWNSLT